MSELIRADMTANVHQVLVAPADRVQAGDILVVLESMKMELPVVASVDGVVADVRVGPGDVVEEGDLIVVVS